MSLGRRLLVMYRVSPSQLSAFVPDQLRRAPAHYPIFLTDGERESNRLRFFVTPKPTEPRVRRSRGQELVLLLEDTQLVIAEADLERLWGFSIERASPGAGAAAHLLCVAGWVLGRTSPAISVEFVYRGSVCWQSPVQMYRVDVAAAYPAADRAEQSGFETSFDVPGTAPALELDVRARLADQSRIPLGTIHARRVWRLRSRTLATRTRAGSKVLAERGAIIEELQRALEGRDQTRGGG